MTFVRLRVRSKVRVPEHVCRWSEDKFSCWQHQQLPRCHRQQLVRCYTGAGPCLLHCHSTWSMALTMVNCQLTLSVCHPFLIKCHGQCPEQHSIQLASLALLLINKSCIVIGNANSIKCLLQETRIYPKDRTGNAYTEAEFYEFARANDPSNVARANTRATACHTHTQLALRLPTKQTNTKSLLRQ